MIELLSLINKIETVLEKMINQLNSDTNIEIVNKINEIISELDDINNRLDKLEEK